MTDREPDQREYLEARVKELEDGVRAIVEDTWLVVVDISDRTHISTVAAAGRLLDVTDSLRSLLTELSEAER